MKMIQMRRTFINDRFRLMAGEQYKIGKGLKEISFHLANQLVKNHKARWVKINKKAKKDGDD